MTDTKVFDIINERVVDMLDKGVVPWHKPWHGAESAPRNVEGRAYSGINAFMLSLAGYSDPRFLTYRKAAEMGGQVRKGEHGYPVVFWKQLVVESEDPETGESRTKRVPMLRYFTVFNVEQVDGLTLKSLPETPEPDHSADVERARTIAEGMPNRPALTHHGDKAYYQPAADEVTLPPQSAFDSDAAYYGTLFHEFSHSTGHRSRLGREGIETFDHFGSDRYAREELVAEFGSAFLMAESGLTNETNVENMAAYIAGWKQRIAEDPRVLVVAGGRGQKAADYILGKVEEKEEEQAA